MVSSALHERTVLPYYSSVFFLAHGTNSSDNCLDYFLPKGIILLQSTNVSDILYP